MKIKIQIERILEQAIAQIIAQIVISVIPAFLFGYIGKFLTGQINLLFIAVGFIVGWILARFVKPSNRGRNTNSEKNIGGEF